VVIAYHLDKLALPLALEVALVISGTIALCWGGFEVVRRIGALRPMFGLKGSFRRQVDAAPWSG
jgi:glucan biosynthesis protein C